MAVINIKSCAAGRIFSVRDCHPKGRNRYAGSVEFALAAQSGARANGIKPDPQGYGQFLKFIGDPDSTFLTYMQFLQQLCIHQIFIFRRI